MSESWLAESRARLARELATTNTLFTRLGDERSQIESVFQRTLTQLGRITERRGAPPAPQVKEQVLAALRAQRYDRLSIREQRYAATLFDALTPPQMQEFLAARPRNWPAFASECFRRWGEFNEQHDRAAFARLLCLAPPTVGFLHSVSRIQDLVARDGHLLVANTLAESDLVGLRDGLRKRGFEPSWSFTALVLATVMASSRESRRSFARMWNALAGDRGLEAMLLPALAKSNSSWFSEEPRPARIRRSVTAQATAVAALISTAYADGVEDGHWSVFTEKLLASTFGDPRIPPESKGWARVREIDARAFENFLHLLISEDIAVFFEHAMQDQRRRDFWLRYLGSLRRTACVLDVNTHERLTRTFAGTDAKYAAAIARARRFVKRTCVQAFCLYFDSIVVVEFAEAGNAAHVYKREYFEQKFERAIRDNVCHDHTALKTPQAQQGRPGIEPRILHMGPWEDKAEPQLRQYLIAPDRSAATRRKNYQ